MSTVMEGNANQDASLRGRWTALSPRAKQLAVGGSLVMFVVLIASTMSGTTAKKATKDPRTRMENALIPKDKVSDLGSAAVSQDLRDTSKRVRDLEGDVARLTQRFEKGASGDAAGAQTNQRLQTEMTQLRSKITELERALGQGGTTGPGQNPQMRPQPAGTLAAPQAQGRQNVPGLGQPEVIAGPPSLTEVRTIGGPEKNEAAARPAVAVAPGRTKPDDGFYLPSGSIIRGVLLNGVDAPTGRAALKDPVPILARIKHEAILPNRYRADVKECFVILDAIGDLPSERVMMRTSSLSCVRKDKSVIDMSLKAYAIGEDGRAGLRGTVISKQGAILAKALVAGFAEGAANAFGGNNQLVGQPNQEGNVDIGRSGRYGVMGGASSALDRVAAYYLDLADQMHPVIEIDSARRVSLVVLQGSQVGGPQPVTPARPGQGQQTTARPPLAKNTSR